MQPQQQQQLRKINTQAWKIYFRIQKHYGNPSLVVSSQQIKNRPLLSSDGRLNAEVRSKVLAAPQIWVSAHLDHLTNFFFSGLHILYLKRDSTQFPRNAYANQIEVYCSKFFYGPLVIVFGDTNPPYRLHDFPPDYLFDKIDPLNEMEQKCYPLPFGKKSF